MATSVLKLSKDLRKPLNKCKSIEESIKSINNYVLNYNPESHSVRQLQIRDSSQQTQWIHWCLRWDSICHLRSGWRTWGRKRAKYVWGCHCWTRSFLSFNSFLGCRYFKTSNLQPPTFDGNLENWPSFIHTFNRVFHNNNTENVVQRLHYLKSSVSGPSANI